MTRAKGEGSIFYSEAKGLYIARVELPPTRDGKRRRKEISGKSHEVVARKLRKLNAEKDAYGGALPTSTMTVEAWGNYWIKNLVNGRLRPNTTRHYARYLEHYVTPTIGKVKLSKLTPAHVRRVLDASPGQSKSFGFSVMRTMFRDALREGNLSVNPCTAIAPPKVRTPDLVVLSPTETRAALDKVLAGPDAVLWAMYIITGARRSEVAGLTWDRVTDDHIEISWQLQLVTPDYDPPVDEKRVHVRGNLWLVPPKTRAGIRLIPNVEPFRTLLAQWRADAPPNPWGLVFTEVSPATGEVVPLNPDRISKRWYEIRDTVGAHGVRLHDLRHGAVDLLYALGVPERIIIEIVGHSSYAQTRAYKSREDYGPRHDAMRAIGSYLSEPLPLTEGSFSDGSSGAA